MAVVSGKALSNRYQVGLAEDVDVGQLDLQHSVQRRQADGDELGRVAAVVSVDLGANATKNSIGG